MEIDKKARQEGETDSKKKRGKTEREKSMIIDLAKVNPHCEIVLFDQISGNEGVDKLIKSFGESHIFYRKKIKIGHFLVHDDGIYDYHKPHHEAFWKCEEESSTKNVELEESSKTSKIPEQKFELFLFDKIIENIEYKDLDGFKTNRKNIELTGIEEALMEDIEGRKQVEYYVIEVENMIRVILVLVHFNKKFTLNDVEQSEIKHLIKNKVECQEKVAYSSLKAKILNVSLNNGDNISYVMYFPGSFLPQIPTNIKTHPLLVHNPICRRSIKKNNHTNRAFRVSNRKRINSEFVDVTIQVGEKEKLNGNEKVVSSFPNYFELVSHSKKKIKSKTEIISQMKIKLQEEVKKAREVLENTLEWKKEEMKDLNEIRNKCQAELKEIIPFIKELKKSGITNVEKYSAEMSIEIEHRNENVEELEREIEDLYLKKLEKAKDQKYYMSKLKKIKDNSTLQLLERQKLEVMKGQLFSPNEEIMKELKKDELTFEDMNKLDHHVEALMYRLEDKINGCAERMRFIQALDQAKFKLSKDGFAKIEQKYYNII